MSSYHKIKSIWKRDPDTHKIVCGDFSTTEFLDLASNKWIWDEKIDGTNIRVMYDPEFETMRFAGRTNNAQIPSPLLDNLRNQFDLDNFRSVFSDVGPNAVCLYGEGYGPKIQKGGGNYRDDQGFILFDIRIGRTWLLRDSIVDIASKLNCDVVPVLGTGNLYELNEYIMNAPKSTFGDFTMEGVVARPAGAYLDRKGQRIITKLKVTDFE